MMPKGYNPLRWDCEKDGCFNVKRRPKIELFASCFPRNIGMGDADGLVEIGGYFLLLEWKGKGGQVHTGQRRTFQEFSRRVGNLVLVIEGDPETMVVWRYCIFWSGAIKPWRETTLAEVQQIMKRWADTADDKGFGQVAT